MRYDSRITRLEALLQPHTVYAVRFSDSDEVELCRSRIRLTVDEFAERYSAGVIIKVIAHGLWEAL